MPKSPVWWHRPVISQYFGVRGRWMMSLRPDWGTERNHRLRKRSKSRSGHNTAFTDTIFTKES